MTEQFLNHTQIRSAFKQVRRSGVAHGVRRHVGRTRALRRAFDNSAHLTLINPFAPTAHEERRFIVVSKFRAPAIEPLLDRARCGYTKRHDSLLVALASDFRDVAN